MYNLFTMFNMGKINVSIRGIDEESWDHLKEMSALFKKTIAQLINEEIESSYESLTDDREATGLHNPYKKGKKVRVSKEARDDVRKKRKSKKNAVRDMMSRPVVQQSKIRDHYDGDDDGCYYGTNGLMNPNKMRVR
jgi:hypothetical protein